MAKKKSSGEKGVEADADKAAPVEEAQKSKNTEPVRQAEPVIEAKKSEESEPLTETAPAKDAEPVTETKEVVSGSDDNLVAAISHALIIFFPVIAPLLIWAVYKDKSRYVKFQSMQALVYQLIAWVIFIGLWIVGILLSVVVIGILLLPLALLQIAAMSIYGLFAAYKTYMGEDFRYAVVADFVEKNM